MANNARPRKLRRISQACDFCHKRSIKCRPSIEDPQQQCQNCYDFANACTYDRPSRRRRNPSVVDGSLLNVLPFRRQPTPPSVTPSERAFSQTCNACARDCSTLQHDGQIDGLSTAWRSFVLASAVAIDQLLELYMDMVYPIFPLFHEPTLLERLRRQEHHVDRPFFASIMGACALTSARLKTKEVASSSSVKDAPAWQSEVFFSAAEESILKDFGKTHNFDSLRACALLALTSIQRGQVQKMQQYLGHYYTLSSMCDFHDESRWPEKLTPVERAERRCLFWSMYKLDVSAAVMFNSIPRMPETHALVAYPTGLSEDNTPVAIVSSDPSCHWMRGWNFTTDLYRVLHYINQRACGRAAGLQESPSIVGLFTSRSITDSSIMENLLQTWHRLPQRLKDFHLPETGIRSEDMLGYQATSIQVALALVRMMLRSGNPPLDLHEKCSIAQHALAMFQSTTPKFLRGLSPPLVYHVGSIGRVFATLLEEAQPTSELYQHVRKLLGALSDFSECFEPGLQSTSHVARDLCGHIARIDSLIQSQPSSTQALEMHMRGHPSIGPPSTQFHLPPDNKPLMMANDFQALAQATNVDYTNGTRAVMGGEWSWPLA